MTTIGEMQDQSTLINGWELLGEAYDVAGGEFARPSGVQNKTNLFDFSSASVTYKKVNDLDAVGVPEFITETELNEGYADEETAEEASDYGVSYSAKLKMEYTKGTFSGDFSAEYSSDYAESNYYWCSHLRAYIKYYQLVLDRGNDPVPGKSYLTAQAQEDLNGTVGEDGTTTFALSPQQLVAKYGTHYMSGVIMGGIWTYSRAYSKFKSDSKSSANAQATASSATWHSSGKLSVDESQAVESTYNEARTYQNGGDPTTLANNGSFDGWKTTVSMANSVLVDFTDESLIPISDLIDSESRRQAVLNQITRVLDNAQLAQSSLAVDNSADSWLRDGQAGSDDSEKSLRVSA
ncbi:MAG: MAC/perforin domain-containing protein, partial [Acidobacteriota bacterium]